MRKLAAIVVVGLALGACQISQPDGEEFRVVATTNILGDIVSNVVGPNARVEVLMPTGVDPHEFQASSRQAAAIARADLVVANGGGLEEGLTEVLEGAAADGVKVIEVLPAVDPIGHDPHFWLDAVRVKAAAVFIAGELGLAPDEYLTRLDSVHAEVEATLAAIPSDRRNLVTNHDAFGYFAERYGFEIVGVVIPGGSTLGDPSSRELADLVAAIERLDVPAIFADTAQPALLAESIAAEAQREVGVVELYSGSLGDPGSGADSLTGMLLINATRIADALGR